MSKTNRRSNDQKGRQRRISVRAVRRASPDLQRLGRAIVSLALAEAAAEAAAQQQAEATDVQTESHPEAGESDD